MKSRPVTIGLAAGEKLMLTAEQRATGIHVIGSPNTGKSKGAEHLIRQDIDAGHSVILIDPHESLYRAAVSYCAWRRPRRPVYLCNVSTGDPVQPLGLLSPTDGDLTVLVDRCIEGTIKACGMLNTDETPRLEKWLRAFYSVVMERGLSLADAELLLDYYAREVRAYLTAGTSVEAEWRQLNEAKTPTQFDDMVGSAKNRLVRFTNSKSIRRFLSLTDPTVTLDLMRFMDVGGVLLVNLKSSQHLSPMNARLFGTLLVTRIFDAARRRAVPDAGPHPKPCYCYIDEAQNFLTADVAEMLAQGRKMGLGLTLIHQTLEQVRAEDPRILAALHGAAKTKIVFAIGSNADATELVHELFPGQIDYNEVKRIDYETRFQPVAERDTTVTVTRGAGTSTTDGTSRERGRSTNVTETVTDEKAAVESDGAIISVGGQQTHGIAIVAGRSSGTSKSHTEADGTTTATSLGDNSGLSTALDMAADGTLKQSEVVFQGQTAATVNGQSHMTGDTEGSFDSVSESVAVAKQTGTTEAHGLTKNRGRSRSRGKARGRTDGMSQSDGESTTNGTNTSESISIGNVPITKQVPYQHPIYTLHSLDEQRQRRADELRRLPQRTCIVRLPDGIAHRVTVSEVKPVLLSRRRVGEYEAEIARKTGALSAAAVDAALDGRRQEIETAAVVHLQPDLRGARNITPLPTEPYESIPQRTAAKTRVRPNPRLNPAINKTKSFTG